MFDTYVVNRNASLVREDWWLRPKNM